jgi:hypothetical protein
VEGRGDEGLPRARGRVEDDVLLLEELEDRRLLGRVEAEAPVLDVGEEAAEELVARGLLDGRDQVLESEARGGDGWFLR